MPNFRPLPRRTLTVLALLLTGSLVAGCAGDPAGGRAGDDRRRVLTTFTVIADMAQQVAGDLLVVESITKPGTEIHEYEPTPSDLVRAADADLILDNGFGLERWFEQFSDRAETPTATLSEGITPIPIAIGDYRGRPNPHAWMSPAAGQVYVRNIATALAGIDPGNAATYRANADAYNAKLQAVGDQLKQRLATLPQAQRALVTCEGAFSYLARDTGLAEGYLWPVNADAEGTPQQIAGAVNFVRRNQVPAVFCESTVNDGAQRQVAKETGAKLAPPLYVDSLSAADGPVPTYLDLLTYDADTIAAALTGTTPSAAAPTGSPR